jgi:hypothetical protein
VAAPGDDVQPSIWKTSLAQLFYLYLWALSESLWYRPYLLFVLLEGRYKAWRGESAWGEMERIAESA